MSLTTYPIALPTATGVKSITVKKRTVVALPTAPFSLVAQAQVWGGQQWMADLVLPKMKRANGEVWAAAFSSLNGQEGSILLGDTANKTPRGIGTGTPLVNGASQTGYNLNTKGWTISQAGILKAGDWIQLGSASTARLYKVMFDANSDGSGNATLTLWPQLRSSPADGAAIVVNTAQGRFMLMKEPDYTIGEDHIYTFGVISFMEDLRP